MKILHCVEQYEPSVGGMQTVVKQLSERLAKMGHDVTVATSFDARRNSPVINGVKIAAFNISGNYARGYQGGAAEIGRYRDFLINSDFDIIAGFAAQQWSVDLALEILDKIRAKKVFVPTGFAGFFLPAYREFYQKMKDWIKEYDLNVFLSDDYRDINFARAAGAKNITVIPNGAGADEFSQTDPADIRPALGIPAGDFLILNVGSHVGTKGHKEAVEIFSRADIKDSTLLIVGNYFPEPSVPWSAGFWPVVKFIIKKIIRPRSGHSGNCPDFCRTAAADFNAAAANKNAGKKLIIAAQTRPETVNAYRSADLFLFPSNIECSPLVLFEAMAAELPFLTTDVGNAREIISWSRGGELLPTVIDKKGYSHARIEESARLLEELYCDKSWRDELGANGFEAWQEKFTWEKISRQYEENFRNLTGN